MAVKHIFLALLTQGSMHGYDLKTSYDALMLHEAELNFGQVYTTLQRLERDGLIVLCVADTEEKKSYALTERGRGELAAWLAAENESSLVLYDELSYKLAAMQVLQPSAFIEAIRAYKKRLLLEMQRLTKKKLAETRIGPRLMLDRSILKLEADMLWSDKCLDVLEKEARCTDD